MSRHIPTFLNVVPVDDEVVVPIRPVLLMVESDSVSQLMDDCPHPVATGPDGYRLYAARSAHMRVASVKGQRVLGYR